MNREPFFIDGFNIYKHTEPVDGHVNKPTNLETKEYEKRKKNVWELHF